MNRETYKALEKGVNCDIAPYFMFDSIFPVLHGARDTSIILATQLDISPQPDYDQASRALQQNRRFTQLHSLGLCVNFTLAPALYKQSVGGKIYFSKNKKDIKQIRKLFKTAFEDFQKGRFSEAYIEAVRLDAQLLGYPECCANQYIDEQTRIIRQLAEEGLLYTLPSDTDIRTREEAKENIIIAGSSERRASLQINAVINESIDDLDESIEDNLDFQKIDELLDPSAYFALTFYPCTPDCTKAREQGRAIAGALYKADPDLGFAYKKFVLIGNESFIWAPGNAVATNNFREYLKHRIKEYQIHEYNTTVQKISQHVRSLPDKPKLLKPPKTFRRKGKKIKANDPCPCGSGKKHKKCCGKKH